MILDETDQPVAVVAALQELQLPHAKLLYILARMYKLQMITETQKLELKCKDQQYLFSFACSWITDKFDLTHFCFTLDRVL